MELWIRSQDKEALIKVDKIFYWNTCPEMPNIGKHYLGNKEWVGNADYTKLGEYETKERALQILDEIQNILNPRIIWHEPITSTKYDENPFETLTTNVIVQTTPKMDWDLKQAGQIVYQMPKE